MAVMFDTLKAATRLRQEADFDRETGDGAGGDVRGRHRGQPRHPAKT